MTNPHGFKQISAALVPGAGAPMATLEHAHAPMSFDEIDAATPSVH